MCTCLSLISYIQVNENIGLEDILFGDVTIIITLII